MKRLILTFFVLTIVACEKKAQQESASTNPEVPVELFFEFEGCKVYRFFDYGRAHYFTNCTETISVQSQPCGKSQCEYPERIGHQ